MPSRREILKAGIVSAASVASGTALSQERTAAPPDTSVIEKQLAKPLSEHAKKLLEASVRNSQNSSKERLKFKLPENSEPCTTYVPGAKK
ncbi:MAG TPA: hypothetical protein VK934_04950 [Fimbriimonas sp.]|nr:hypothetical protein [Fimbriimonas sp.]